MKAAYGAWIVANSQTSSPLISADHGWKVINAGVEEMAAQIGAMLEQVAGSSSHGLPSGLLTTAAANIHRT